MLGYGVEDVSEVPISNAFLMWMQCWHTDYEKGHTINSHARHLMHARRA
jgi:hypothetical protein